jgi:hypothetical protein
MRPSSDEPWLIVVEEFWIPRSHERADMAAVSSILEGFEIKSSGDSLKRLPRQADAYARLFDHCTAVVAERHVKQTVDLLPEWWGVFIITPSLTFTSVRLAKHNDRVDSETLVRLLWRDEVHAALSRLGVETDRRAARTSLWESLLRFVDLDALKGIVRHALSNRDPASARIPKSAHRIKACSTAL